MSVKPAAKPIAAFLIAIVLFTQTVAVAQVAETTLRLLDAGTFDEINLSLDQNAGEIAKIDQRFKNEIAGEEKIEKNEKRAETKPEKVFAQRVEKVSSRLFRLIPSALQNLDAHLDRMSDDQRRLQIASLEKQMKSIDANTEVSRQLIQILHKPEFDSKQKLHQAYLYTLPVQIPELAKRIVEGGGVASFLNKTRIQMREVRINHPEGVSSNLDGDTIQKFMSYAFLASFLLLATGLFVFFTLAIAFVVADVVYFVAMAGCR